MILLNNIPIDDEKFSEKTFENGLSIYEVIRIFHGHPIFLKDNLMRLDNSLKKSNIDIHVQNLNIPEKLRQFISLQHITEGNLKYVLHFTIGKTDEYIFQIPHSYPSARDYENGVPTLTYKAVRKNPEVKYINTELRVLTNNLIQKNHVYEILLVDEENYLTEGSRSNLFLIKDNKLYTSPSAYVLPGTSRKRVFEICRKCHIPIVEERIAYDSLPGYDTAFLTGTSPLILPINRINEINYATDSSLLRQLMEHYFALLEE